MTTLYLEPTDPEEFETLQKVFEGHKDFETQKNTDEVFCSYNALLDICVYIDHPYSVKPCNPTPP
jgi:hypothetical protein